jgi:hypothetical protein
MQMHHQRDICENAIENATKRIMAFIGIVVSFYLSVLLFLFDLVIV